MTPKPHHLHHLRRAGQAAIAAALPLALAACSSSPSASGTSSTSRTTAAAGSSGAAALPSCDKVPATEVNSALGTELTGPAPQSGASDAVTCYYSKQGSDLPSAIIRYQSGASASTLASDKSQESQAGFAVQDVAGLGDGAWSGTMNAAGATTSVVEVLKGSTIVQVSGPATVVQVQSLATRVLGLV